MGLLTRVEPSYSISLPRQHRIIGHQVGNVLAPHNTSVRYIGTMSQLPAPQAFSSEWPSQVISWRFERAWDPNQIAAFTIPDAEDSTTLNARDGVIPGGEPEG